MWCINCSWTKHSTSAFSLTKWCRRFVAVLSFRALRIDGFFSTIRSVTRSMTVWWIWRERRMWWGPTKTSCSPSPKTSKRRSAESVVLLSLAIHCTGCIINSAIRAIFDWALFRNNLFRHCLFRTSAVLVFKFVWVTLTKLSVKIITWHSTENTFYNRLE